MFVFNWATLVEVAIVALPFAAIALQMLEKQKFIAQSTAWTNVVKGCELAVNEMEVLLKGIPPGSANEANVLDAAVTDVRQVYERSIKMLGGNTVITDDVLHLIIAKVQMPGGVQSLLNEFFAAGTVSLPGSVKPVTTRVGAMMAPRIKTTLGMMRPIL